MSKYNTQQLHELIYQMVETERGGEQGGEEQAGGEHCSTRGSEEVQEGWSLRHWYSCWVGFILRGEGAGGLADDVGPCAVSPCVDAPGRPDAGAAAARPHGSISGTAPGRRNIRVSVAPACEPGARPPGGEDPPRASPATERGDADGVEGWRACIACAGSRDQNLRWK